TSAQLDTAQEAWERAIDLAEFSDSAVGLFTWPPRRANGQQELRTVSGTRYKIAAANRRGGRGLSVDLGIAAELREQRDWTAWSALSGATTARPNPLLIAISNAGDDGSVVLNSLRSAGLAFIDSGE